MGILDTKEDDANDPLWDTPFAYRNHHLLSWLPDEPAVSTVRRAVAMHKEVLEAEEEPNRAVEGAGGGQTMYLKKVFQVTPRFLYRPSFR